MGLINYKKFTVNIKKLILCYIILFLFIFLLSACDSPISGNQETLVTTAAGALSGDPNSSTGEKETYDTSMLLNRIERSTWNIELSIKEITGQSVVVIVKDMDNKGYFSIPQYFNLEYLNDSGWVKLTNHKDPTGVWDYAFTIPQKDNDYIETYAFIDLIMLYDINILVPGKYRGVLYFNDHKGSEGIHEFRVEFELSMEQISKIKEAK